MIVCIGREMSTSLQKSSSNADNGPSSVGVNQPRTLLNQCYSTLQTDSLPSLIFQVGNASIISSLLVSIFSLRPLSTFHSLKSGLLNAVSILTGSLVSPISKQWLELHLTGFGLSSLPTTADSAERETNFRPQKVNS